MTDAEKVKLAKALLLSAFDSGMIGSRAPYDVGYVNGVLDAVYQILTAEEGESDERADKNV